MTEQSSENNDFEESTPKTKNLVGEVSFLGKYVFCVVKKLTN